MINLECPGPDSVRLWGIRAQGLFDGHAFVSGAPLVLVRQGRIVDVDLSGARPSPELPVVDLGTVTLLPGLVDAHTHLAFDPSGSVVEQLRNDSDEVVVDRIRRHARQALQAGVTTVRDLGDRGYLSLMVRSECASRMAAGPEILASGPPITSHGGHCWFLGGEAAGVAGVRAAVAERLSRGVDVVKVMATGGGITPGSDPHLSQYTVDELRAVVTAAHEAGTWVTAHAHGGAGIAAAVAAGVDGIEHGTFLTPAGAEPEWATVAAMAASGVYVGVTAARMPEGEPPSPRVLAARECLPRMHREGVRLVCSSDAGVVGSKPHDCLPHGVAEFAGFAELSCAEALAAVTSVAARSCGVGDRKGRIAAGYDADLLAVSGDVSQDLTALSDAHAVFRGGQRVPR
ncbi:amidohydrolase family protein [Nocardia sp. NPDC051570]|uniref:amidohydrolase family protein n=1 Tax=Nocardia sp. NPDC051570 TaxID=3364324 RepID=UPI00379CF001